MVQQALYWFRQSVPTAASPSHILASIAQEYQIIWPGLRLRASTLRRQVTRTLPGGPMMCKPLPALGQRDRKLGQVGRQAAWMVHQAQGTRRLRPGELVPLLALRSLTLRVGVCLLLATRALTLVAGVSWLATGAATYRLRNWAPYTSAGPKISSSHMRVLPC